MIMVDYGYWFTTERIATLFDNFLYSKKGPISGPIVNGCTIQGTKVLLTFDSNLCGDTPMVRPLDDLTCCPFNDQNKGLSPVSLVAA